MAPAFRPPPVSAPATGLHVVAVAVLILPIVGLCIGLVAYCYREKKRRVRLLNPDLLIC